MVNASKQIMIGIHEMPKQMKIINVRRARKRYMIRTHTSSQHGLWLLECCTCANQAIAM